MRTPGRHGCRPYRDTGRSYAGLDRTNDQNQLIDADDAVINDADGNPLTVVPVAVITWSDDDAVATSLSLSQSVSYHLASDAGGGVRHTVTATLTDQYGDPVPGVVVNFWSNANNS